MDRYRVVLHFLPAILLLLVNGHLSSTGDVSQWLFTDRVIHALSRPADDPRDEMPVSSMRLAVRALAWVNRWQSLLPDQDPVALDERQTVLGSSDPLRFEIIVKASDRSRDGPVAG